MTTPFRNSNPAGLKILSLASSAALSLFVFLIFPASGALSASVPPAEIRAQPKTFASLTQPPSLPKKADSNLKNLRAGSRSANPQSAKVKIEIPGSDYGRLAVESAGPSGFFEMSDFAEFEGGAESFEMGIFDFSELDGVPRCLKRGALQYPRNMYERGVEGGARLSVFINKDGTVELDEVESFTHEEFLQAAKNSLKFLLYESPMRGGEPVKARFVLPVNFKIKK